MTIIEVNSSSAIKKFHNLPYDIYKTNKNWIPHIKQEVETVFNPKKNKFFRHGIAKRWILQNSEGKIIGRIAAFINRKKAFTERQPTGGIGFFESIDNKEAAHKLFNTAKKWLKSKDMQAMDGPINFGERDRYWGLLVKGFENAPIYGNAYQPKYYENLFTSFGFKTYFEQYMFIRSLNDPIPEKYQQRANNIVKDKGYTFKHLEKSKMFEYAEDFRLVYNKAWTKHSNFKGMSETQARSIMRKLKPVMDPELIWFAYYNNKPVGFFISLPELNQIFKHVNGNFNWIGKIKFLLYKFMGNSKNIFGIAFGIIPDHQKKGLEGALIMRLKKQLELKNKYKNIIITWVGDFNPKMIRIIENLGTRKYMTLKTYRHLFDKNAKFERCKTI